MIKHTQTICWQQLTICLSVFHHFVELTLKGLNIHFSLFGPKWDKIYYKVWGEVNTRFDGYYTVTVINKPDILSDIVRYISVTCRWRQSRKYVGKNWWIRVPIDRHLSFDKHVSNFVKRMAKNYLRSKVFNLHESKTKNSLNERFYRSASWLLSINLYVLLMSIE